MPEAVNHADAYILMAFRDAVEHLKGRPLTPELKQEVGKVARPYYKQLVAKGLTAIDAARLLQRVYEG